MPAVPGGPTRGPEVGGCSGEASAAARDPGQDPGVPAAKPPVPFPGQCAGFLSQSEASVPSLYHPLQDATAAGQ